jgi:hypothetical protein
MKLGLNIEKNSPISASVSGVTKRSTNVLRGIDKAKLLRTCLRFPKQEDKEVEVYEL